MTFIFYDKRDFSNNNFSDESHDISKKRVLAFIFLTWLVTIAIMTQNNFYIPVCKIARQARHARLRAFMKHSRASQKISPLCVIACHRAPLHTL